MDLRKTTHIRAPPLTNGRILIYFEKKLTIRYQDTNRRPTLRASEGRAAESNKFSDRKRVASCRNWYCSHACSSSSLHNFWSTFLHSFLRDSMAAMTSSSTPPRGPSRLTTEELSSQSGSRDDGALLGQSVGQWRPQTLAMIMGRREKVRWHWKPHGTKLCC